MAFPLVYPALFGAFEGLKINNETRLRLLDEAQTRLADNKNKLTVMAADPDFNPSSPQQVSTFLYDVLGASKPPRAKSASASDATSRKIISLQHPLIAMFCDTINEYAKDAKAISTYFGFLQWNERMLWSLDPFGTDTGRFASQVVLLGLVLRFRTSLTMLRKCTSLMRVTYSLSLTTLKQRLCVLHT